MAADVSELVCGGKALPCRGVEGPAVWSGPDHAAAFHVLQSGSLPVRAIDRNQVRGNDGNQNRPVKDPPEVHRLADLPPFPIYN